MLSFREFIFYFPSEVRHRIFEFIFLKSKKVLNFNQYISEKTNLIDFPLKLTKKFCSQLTNSDYPLTRLSNCIFFNKRKWYLFQGVFSPRAESELLVDLLKKWVQKLNLSYFSYIDLCSGSGVIFLSVMKDLEGKIKKGVAIDSSFVACKNIIKNFSLNIYSSKSNIYLVNWIKFLNLNNKWEVITMNPPYLSEKEFNDNKLIYSWDPKNSLQGKENGWFHYLKMLEFAKNNFYWKIIILECSEFHEEKWDQEMLNNNFFEIHKYRDYLGKFRAVALIKK